MERTTAQHSPGDPVHAGPDDHESRHLLRETWTMALYVAVCLLAAVVALPEEDWSHTDVVTLIWGVTIGLALAHWFAFRVSGQLVATGGDVSEEARSGLAQLAGAAGAALLATIPAAFVPDSVEVPVVELVLSAAIAAVGFLVARGAGAGKVRAAGYALVVLLVASAIAAAKNFLVGH